MLNSKETLLPIEVPMGDYCWGGRSSLICQFFDSEGGHPVCQLGLGDLKFDKADYVKKPDKCRNLKTSY